ncbi:MAG TPA: TetR/AcrR family transcriptional regulator [Vicinamibacterales bacterium]|nr:TetR/AcrR family transcriptional regulator [Vicinamibacterales bacterium]
MSRTSGSRNRNYDSKRLGLLKRLGPRLADLSQSRPSFREMAGAAGVSVPTLRHYFADRDGVVQAYLAWQGNESARYRPLVSSSDEPFAQSIRRLLHGSSFGLKDMDRIRTHVVGLTEGLHNERVGPSYLQATLEPLLASVEQRLALHLARGEMRAVDLRHAAVSLVAPLLLAILHQRELGGTRVRSLEMERFIDDHADGFVRAYAAATSPPRRRAAKRPKARAAARRRR